MKLLQRSCIPYEGDQSPLDTQQELTFMAEIPSWSLQREEVHRIEREYSFSDFPTAIHFVRDLAEIAENEGHHPEIRICYDKVRLELHTHSVGGLSENDFIMAAKIDALFDAKNG